MYTNRKASRRLLCPWLMAVITLAAAFVLPALKASAETGSIIAPTSVSRGSEITVTVSITTDEPYSYISGNLSYDNNVTYVSSNSDSNGGEGMLVVRYSPPPEDETSSAELTFTFNAASEGSCNFGFSGYAFSADGVVLAAPELSTTVNITERTGGLLRSLSPSEGELLPAFSPDIFDYVLKVGSDVQYVDFTASALADTDVITPDSLRFWSLDDPNAKKITVTDASGAERVYNVMIIRDTADNGSSDEDESTEESTAASSEAADTSAAEASVPQETQASSQADTQEQDTQPAADDAQPDTEDSSESRAQKGNVFSSGSDSSRDSGMSSLRRTLMPALLISLAVLIAALFIIIYWLKNRSERRRKKIQSSHKNKKR